MPRSPGRHLAARRARPGLVPGSWLWILALVPLGPACKLVIATRVHRAGQRASPAVATGLTGVVGVTDPAQRTSRCAGWRSSTPRSGARPRPETGQVPQADPGP